MVRVSSRDILGGQLPAHKPNTTLVHLLVSDAGLMLGYPRGKTLPTSLNLRFGKVGVTVMKVRTVIVDFLSQGPCLLHQTDVKLWDAILGLRVLLSRPSQACWKALNSASVVPRTKSPRACSKLQVWLG